ncbi:MAG: hypothetical protein WCD79_07910 [Chthoniobacteraceae bacterium]
MKLTGFRFRFLSIVLCLLLADAAWKLWFGGGILIAYKMPRDGDVTLGLYGRDGKLLRCLAQDVFRRAGDRRAFWNGLDQWGNPVAAGDYELKAVYHDPLSVEYKMTVCNPGTPPWPTPDGKGDWLCDEANPQAAVTDGKWVFLASAGCEKGYSIIALDENGQRQWGTNEPKHFHPRCMSLALDGDYLYALYSGPEVANADHNFGPDKAYGRAVLVCFDKRTGKLARFSGGSLLNRFMASAEDFVEVPERFSNGRLLNQIAKWDYKQDTVSWLWDLRNGKSFTPATYAGAPRYACNDVGESTNALGIVAAGGRIYVSLLHDDKLLVISPETGRPTGEEIALKAPAGLCASGDNQLLAVSGTQIVTVDPATKTVTPLIATGLEAPSNIATDGEGNIYVSDWGSSFQVKVFDRTGNFLHAIGKAGGRPWVGPWDAAGMLVPRGIAVTPKGELWVAEDDGSPCRTSVWNAKSGAFLKDYIGPVPYGGGTNFWIDPQDVTEVNAEGTRFKVDYDKKSYTPEAIAYRRVSRDDPFTPNGHTLADCQVRILHHGGHEYAVTQALAILQRQGDIYRAVAAFGSVNHRMNTASHVDEIGQIVWDSDVGYRMYKGFYPECFEGHGGDIFTWTDTNGDNLVQPDEMHWAKTPRGPWQSGVHGALAIPYWGLDIAQDWSFFFAERFLDHIVIYRLKPRGWTDAGAPIYDIADAKPIIFDSAGNAINGLHVTMDGKLIVSYNFEAGHRPDAIRAYDLDGHALWAIAMPKRLADNNVHASNANYDFQIPGVGDVICTWLYHGSGRPFLITSDGLTVGTLLDDTRLARLLHWYNVPMGDYVCSFLDTTPTGPTALWTESAKYFHQSPNGDCYIINGANQQEHILQIKGLEAGATGRFSMAYSFTENDLRRAAMLRWIP